jgi:hypothetical protein
MSEFGFLIYCCFESKISPHLSGSTVGGSLLLDKAVTETEAVEKVAMYQKRAETPSETRRYIYIKNQPHWW